MKKYFSQFGEDEWIDKNLKPDIGFFLDVGASDGIVFSNTLYFELAGWKGLCIEPNPRSFLVASFIRDNLIQKCVGLENKQVSYYQDLGENDLSGLKKYPNREYRELKVEMIRLDRVIKLYDIKKIDLLSIDTEGTELDVLKSFDIKAVPPRIIIIEHFSQRNENQYLKDFFKDLPYKLVHETRANSIYSL